MYLSLRCWRAASDTSDMNDKRRYARHFRRLSVAGPTRRLLAGGRLVVRWRAKTDHPLSVSAPQRRGRNATEGGDEHVEVRCTIRSRSSLANRIARREPRRIWRKRVCRYRSPGTTRRSSANAPPRWRSATECGDERAWVKSVLLVHSSFANGSKARPGLVRTRTAQTASCGSCSAGTHRQSPPGARAPRCRRDSRRRPRRPPATRPS
jgi:hypothetical protein